MSYMKLLLSIIILLTLSSCAIADKREFDCQQSSYAGTWNQIYPDELMIEHYISVIDKKSFSRSRYKFWYQNQHNQVLACGFKRFYEANTGCSIKRYLLNKEVDTYKVTDSAWIVCT